MANIYGSPFNDNDTFNNGQFRPLLAGTLNSDNIYGRAGNDTLYGYAGNDTLFGEAGNDYLAGDDGNDTLNGGSGSDTLVGGNGDDTYIVDSVNDTIREYEGGGSFDTVLSSVNYTLGAWLNNLTLTGTGGINGTGNELNNTIRGNDGNNTLNGGGGSDTLIGGKGDDTYIVDSTSDTILEYEGGGSFDTVLSSVNYTLGAWLNNLTLTGTSNINGTGNELGNTIIGNTGTNILRGGAGNDVLEDGGDGNDSLYGGAGDDLLRGGDGLEINNEVYMDGGDGNDSLFSAGGTLYGGNGDDDMDGVYSTLYGGNGNDTIYAEYSGVHGEAGNDVLRGADANLNGGNGNDILTCYYTGSLSGGAGADRFVFNSPSDGLITIEDFVVADDTIEVSASGFGGGFTAGSAITQAQFTLGSSASNTSQRFIYDKFNTGALYFDEDGLGGTDQVQFATLSTGLAMTNNDIYVFA